MELAGKKYGSRDWRKLLATRRGTVIVAGVCAVVAAGILIFAMQRYRSNVNAEGTPETVLVASGLIQKGTSGDAIASGQLFKATSIPGKQVSEGALADTAQLHGKVATADIYPGQQLTASEFTGNGGLPSELAPDQRAMSVTVDSARGMIGQIQTGDHVDVYADLEVGTGRNEQFVKLLLSDVQVLKAAASPTSSNIGGGASPQNQQSNVTLKVNSDQAGELAYASDNGKVWLVLRPANSPVTAPSGPVSVTSLLSANAASSTGGGK
jgi:pilus assembly protein CpaB